MSDFLVLVTNPDDGAVASYRLHGDRLSPLEVSKVAKGCGTFAVDAERDLVHAASKSGPSIVTCRLDRSTGALTPVGEVEAPGSPTYLELAHSGTVLLAAYYSEGIGEARPVTDGVVGEPVGRIENRNLHCVVPSGDSQYASFVSLGDDLVATCRVGEDATLERLGDASAPKGSGPRHLIFDADERHAYVVTEYSGEVLTFDRGEDGLLTPTGATAVVDPSYGLGHSRIGADPREEHLIWGADLHLSADGRTLWSTERTEGVLATSPVDQDGKLGAPVSHLRTEPQPRGFNVSPDGRHLVVAGEISPTLSLYRVGDDGIPELLEQVPTGMGANWVRFVSL